MAKKERKNGTKLLMKMIQTALLSAIIVVMAYTPIGFLKIGIVEITFITIPVIVGAIVIGPLAGAFLGAVFGTVSFIQCFGMSPFGAAMLGISPVNAFLVCVPTRILMGLLCALIFKAMNRSKKAGIISVSVSSISGALLNTVFFVGTFILLFGKTDFFADLSAGKNIVAFIGAFVGLNGLVEAIACFVIATAVSKALITLNRKMKF